MDCSNRNGSAQAAYAGGDRPGVVALVGNPNVGKSVIFSLLTGRYVVVSNYPGTTVEVSSASVRLAGRHADVIDTPGVNSLIPRSEDEEVARAILLDRPPRAVLQVLDAKNLRRGLLVTTQLGEMGLPTALALNMWDEAMDRGISIDADRLSRMLGVPVVKTVATQKKGIGRLASLIGSAAVPVAQIDYGPVIEEGVRKLEPLLPELHLRKRAMALMLLAGDPGLEARITSEVRGPDGRVEGPGLGARGQGRRRRKAGKAGPGSRARAPRSEVRIRGSGAGGSGPGKANPVAGAPGREVGRAIAAVREEAQKKLGQPLSYVISRKRAAYVEGIAEEVMTAHQPRESTRFSRAAFYYAFAPLLSLLVCYLSASILVGAAEKFVGSSAGTVFARWAVTVGGAGAYVAYLFRWKRAAPSARALLGRVLVHPVLAFPVVAAALWVVYTLVGGIGAGACVDFIESKVFGTTTQPSGGFAILGLHVPFDGINYYLARLAAPIVSRDNLIYQLLLGEDAGLIRVGLTDSIAILLPIIGFFFLAFALMEDSGYLPRLAIMVDWLLKKVGLNGKAVLPIVLGMGCGTMATLTTRILDTRRERLIATFLLALAIPCSAQLGIISGVLADIGGGGAFALYVLVIASQFLVAGYLASKVLKGRNSDFLLEVPPLRVPRLKSVLTKTFYRIAWFLKEAVPLFLLGTLVLFILTRVGYNENSRPLGLLSYVERIGAPITEHWLGLPKTSGPEPEARGRESEDQRVAPGRSNSTTEAFIRGFLRRDYAAVSIRKNFQKGFYSPRQAMVALVVITLFVPCVATLFVIIKERGIVTGAIIVGFIVPYAFLVGGLLNRLLSVLNYEF